ncbi:unnamed protein product [Ceratitis capitata]|uniref:(Mediterranean fruit fly) hypothetical protein n=1 Tax=Ceratitis capitata TaxID=7213 RepID=A0A811URG7_CERCA|nr:unnamed protein product [Ceratitis capitata]
MFAANRKQLDERPGALYTVVFPVRGPFYQMQQEEDFVPISIANRNNSISHRHCLEELVEVSPQMEN